MSVNYLKSTTRITQPPSTSADPYNLGLTAMAWIRTDLRYTEAPFGIGSSTDAERPGFGFEISPVGVLTLYLYVNTGSSGLYAGCTQVVNIPGDQYSVCALATAANVIQTNTWTHIGFTMSDLPTVGCPASCSVVAKLYVNGLVKASLTIPLTQNRLYLMGYDQLIIGGSGKFEPYVQYMRCLKASETLVTVSSYHFIYCVNLQCKLLPWVCRVEEPRIQWLHAASDFVQLRPQHHKSNGHDEK
jgi:Concanavalin A-like lectin/glucanases superfamily